MDQTEYVLHSQRHSRLRTLSKIAVIVIVVVAISTAVYFLRQSRSRNPSNYTVEVTSTANATVKAESAIVDLEIWYEADSLTDATTGGTFVSTQVSNRLSGVPLEDLKSGEAEISSSNATDRYVYRQQHSFRISDINNLDSSLRLLALKDVRVTITFLPANQLESEKKLRDDAYSKALDQAHAVAKRQKRYLGELTSELKTSSITRPSKDASGMIDIEQKYAFRFNLYKRFGILPLI